MDFTLYWFMLPVSIVVATCAMLSGIGGAALFTPIFILVFPLLGPEYVLSSTVAAISAALITQTFGFLSGFIGYSRRHLIDYRTARRMLVVAVPVAVLGAFTGTVIHESFLLGGYAVLVFVLAMSLFLHRPAKARPVDESREHRRITDSSGRTYEFIDPPLGWRSRLLTATGAFLTGMVSVGIGEVTISQLTRRGIPIAIAAATSVLVVILTVAAASTTLAAQLIREGGWTAVPWNLLVYDIPGVLIGGQIGPRLAGKVSQAAMQRAIAVLFVGLAIAMMFVAWRRMGG